VTKEGYVDPMTGGFIGEDPLGFKAGDTNLNRYVNNDPINRIDPFGKRDVRWPFNGALSNQSNEPVYPLVSSSEEDHYEKLLPGQSTPNTPGHFKDIDGVWVYRNKRWLFYPNFVRNIVDDKIIIVNCDGVYDQKGRPIPSWDPKNPTKNKESAPYYINDKGESKGRGRPESNIPPDLYKFYPDATSRDPVKSGLDTYGTDWRERLKNSAANGFERIINGSKNFVNPRFWRNIKF
jgi:hypothetical protein